MDSDQVFVAGDVVTFEHEDGSRLVRQVHGSPNLYVNFDGFEIDTRRLLEGGWKIAKVRHFSVPLPTAPGSVITWRDGAYLPQIAQLDCNPGNLGWRHQKDDDPRWFTAEQMAAEVAGHRWTLLGVTS